MIINRWTVLTLSILPTPREQSETIPKRGTNHASLKKQRATRPVTSRRRHGGVSVAWARRARGRVYARAHLAPPHTAPHRSRPPPRAHASTMREKISSHDLTQNSILRINDRKTLQLISEYKKEPCLWNSSLNDYPNKSKRARAAEKIARILNIKNFEGKHVMIKFKNLRNSYSQELKKIKHSIDKVGPNSPELYKPKVPWFPLMDSFIRPHLQTSRLLGNDVSFFHY